MKGDATRGGRAWVFGPDVDTDLLAPGAYMKEPVDVLAHHCLEAIAPRFATEVRPGDVVVGGKNFGMGSSREQAAQALKHLGVAAVVAPSFAGIFYRNALNLGLLALVCAEADRIVDGERLAIDEARAWIERKDHDEKLEFEPLPDFLLQMVADGGLTPHLEKKLKGRGAGR